MVAFC